MKSSTKIVLAGLSIAAVAAGAYYLYRNKDEYIKTEEVVNPDGSVKKRTYVSIDVDGTKEKLNNTIEKTKEAATDTIKKVENKFDFSKKNADDVPADFVEIVDDSDDNFFEEAKEVVEEETAKVEEAVEEVKDTFASEEFSFTDDAKDEASDFNTAF